MSLTNRRHPVWVTVLIFAVLKKFGDTEAFICPPPGDIAPCECVTINDGQYLSLNCTGSGVDDGGIIENLLSTLRAVNNVSTSDPAPHLKIADFLLEHTALQSLNLTPLALVEIYQLELEYNDKLIEIVGGTNSTEEEDLKPFRFTVNHFYLLGGQYTNDSLTQLMKFVVPENVRSFLVQMCKFVGSEDGYDGHELFPGLSSLINLTKFLFYRSSGLTHKKITGAPFKNNHRLIQIELSDIDGSNEVGIGAFIFDPPLSDLADTVLDISLTSLNLTDDKIHPDNGLEFIGRPATINLQDNSFEFISAEKFFHFLLADDRNEIILVNNPFICDERMRWLRDGREQLENRVLFVNCLNDPGKTIFNTDLLA